MKNRVIKLLVVLGVFLLTGCTKQLKDSNNKVVVNEKTGQSITENIIFNTRHGVWDSDRCETWATIESMISNTRHRIRDSDRGETWASIVFAKYCIPIRCTYKGRKMILVVSWALERGEDLTKLSFFMTPRKC